MDIFNPTEREQITAATSTNTTTINSAPSATTISHQQQKQNADNNNSQVTIDTKQMQSELERRQQELEIKAAELAAREEALRQGGDFRRQHNWPPLPSFCPIKPCFFQDINVDIRPEFQRIVQLGYHLWVAFVFTLILNLFASILLLSFGIERAGENVSFGLMMFIFLVPLTYVSWFRPLYKAFRSDSSFNFMVYFFVFFMQIIVVGLWSLGLPSQGPCGLYVAMKHMGTNTFLALVLFVVTAAWMTYTTASVLFLSRVHSIYRSSGASMAKARNEFAQGIIGNQYVQQTVASAARQTVNQTFQAATSSSGQAGGTR